MARHGRSTARTWRPTSGACRAGSSVVRIEPARTTRLHPQARRSAETNRCADAGGQDRPARGRAGVAVRLRVDFKGFSYGFRPGRSPHLALDALAMGITIKRVGWVLSVDIRGFFDAMSHEWIAKFVEHRIADQRVLRHIQKWLTAGVLEEGERRPTVEGSPQGGSISPLISNVYLHYAFDLWADHWRRHFAHGDVVLVRFADDIVVGFQHRSDAERFQRELADRFRRFNLELHPEKTRLIEFGQFVDERRARRGQGKPETFEFLGFTHVCSRTRTRKKFLVLRRPMASRMAAKLKEIKLGLRRRMHLSIADQGNGFALSSPVGIATLRYPTLAECW